MELVVNASALVRGLLRRRGKLVLTHPKLDPFITPPQWEEAMHELEWRVRHVAGRLGRDPEELLAEARALGVSRRTSTVRGP